MSALDRVAALPAAAVARPVAAAGRLYEQAIDRVLATPHRVSTAAEAERLLESAAGAGPSDGRALAEQIGRVATLAAPVVRRLRMAEKLPGLKKLPMVYSLTTVAGVTFAIRRGVHDVQVVGSYLANRLEQATGEAPDAALVKAATVHLYLSPRGEFQPDEGLRPARLLQRWLLRGATARLTQSGP